MGVDARVYVIIRFIMDLCCTYRSLESLRGRFAILLSEPILPVLVAVVDRVGYGKVRVRSI